MSHPNHQSYGYRNAQNDGYNHRQGQGQDYRSNPNGQNYPPAQRQQHQYQPQQHHHQQQHYRSPPPPQQNLNSRDVYCDPKFYGDADECQLNIEGVLSPLKQLDVNSIPSDIMLKTNRIDDVVAAVSNNGRPGNNYRPPGGNNYRQQQDWGGSGNQHQQQSYYNQPRQQQHPQSRGSGGGSSGGAYGNSRQSDQGNQSTSSDYNNWDGPEIDHWNPPAESKAAEEESESRQSPVQEEYEEPKHQEYQQQPPQQSLSQQQTQQRVQEQQTQQRVQEQQTQQRVQEQQTQQRVQEQQKQQRVQEHQTQQRVQEHQTQQRVYQQQPQQRSQQYQSQQPVYQQQQPRQQFQQQPPQQQLQRQRPQQQFQQHQPHQQYQYQQPQQRSQQNQAFQQQQSAAPRFNFNLAAKEFKPNVVYYQQQTPALPVTRMPPSSQWISEGDAGNFGGPKLEQLLNGGMDEGELIEEDQESHFVWENVIQTINQLTVNPGAFNRSSKKMISILKEHLHEPLTLDLILTFIIEQSVTTPNFCYTGARLCEALRNSEISVQVEGGRLTLIKNAMLERVHLEFTGVLESLKYDGSPETHERARGMIMFTAELYLNLIIHTQGKTKKNKLFGLACLEIMETLLKFRPVYFENVKTVFQALKLMGWDFEQEADPACREWLEKILSEVHNINEDPETDRRSKGIVSSLIDLKAKNWNKEEANEKSVEPSAHNPYKNSYAEVTQAYELPEMVDDDDEEYVDDQPEEFQRAYEEFLQMTAK